MKILKVMREALFLVDEPTDQLDSHSSEELLKLSPSRGVISDEIDYLYFTVW